MGLSTATVRDQLGSIPFPTQPTSDSQYSYRKVSSDIVRDTYTQHSAVLNYQNFKSLICRDGNESVQKFTTRSGRMAEQHNSRSDELNAVYRCASPSMRELTRGESEIEQIERLDGFGVQTGITSQFCGLYPRQTGDFAYSWVWKLIFNATEQR